MLNDALRLELLAMQEADLALRDRLIASGSLFEGYHEEMASLHRSNARRLRQILQENGWPGRSLAAADGCDAAWLVLQHAIVDPPLMQMAEPLLQQAVERGEAPPACLAYLADRIRTLQGLPQWYGTQHDWDDAGNMSPLPTEDAADVNRRRAALGMESQEDHTARLRAQARKAGQCAPADLESYRQRGRDWAKSVGWHSGRDRG